MNRSNKFTSNDLYDQIVSDGEPSVWLCRILHLNYGEVLRAFFAGLHDMNYEPSKKAHEMAYKAGLTIHRLEDKANV